MSITDATPEQLAAYVTLCRRVRLAEGYDALCRRCGQQLPKAWLVDGRCLQCAPVTPSGG
jgi:hypothetical protein